MAYVDGYLIPVAKKNVAKYRTIAAKAGKIWKEHGALDYKECVGNDLRIKGFVPFTKAAQAKSNETVIFAFVVYKSRKHRDAVNARVMKDPRIQSMCDVEHMPFDPARMAYGGFEVIVDPR